jgi:hypothetical protein
MIIPVRCFTCGKVVGNKWERYLQLVQSEYKEGCVCAPRRAASAAAATAAACACAHGLTGRRAATLSTRSA